MHPLIAQKLEGIRKLIKTEIGKINYMNDIDFSRDHCKSFLYPTNDLWLYERQFDAVTSLVRPNENLYVFQVDDLSELHVFSAPFDYKSYCDLNLYSLAMLCSDAEDWLLIVDEEFYFGIGILVATEDVNKQFEKAYGSGCQDLLRFVKKHLDSAEEYERGCTHLKTIIEKLILQEG